MNIAMRARIKRMREEKGISQGRMADLLHMDERNYKRIENGEKKTMDLDLLGRIAEVLEADVTELLSESVYIEHADIHDNPNSANVVINNGELNITNTPDLTQEMLRVLEANQKTLEENNRLIALLIAQKK